MRRDLAAAPSKRAFFVGSEPLALARCARVASRVTVQIGTASGEVSQETGLIAGKAATASDSFSVVDPATGQELARVSSCGPGEVDAAVSAAAEAAPSWARSRPSERAAILERLAGLIRRDLEALAGLESRDTGKPLRQARVDIEVTARYFEYYAHTVEALFGETVPVADELLVYTTREPHGVTGHIIPWNYPAQITARTIAPALATGNACVLKPAEEAPLTPIQIGRLALEAGVPPGVLNVVPGLGETAGAALAQHPGLGHLSFTGSPEIGRVVGKAAAENVVPVTLELGGKSPNVVFADADLGGAVPAIVNSILQNAGQTCSAGSRLLVDRRVHDELVERVSERFAATRIGPGIEDPDLGPLISSTQQERVLGFVERPDGARLLCGGRPPADGRLSGGYFVEPTLFDDVDPQSPLGREEVFGPVLAVTSFDEPGDAVELANATDYGLIAAVWTRDIARAHRLARDLQCGQVYVNTFGAGGGVELAFGGYKQSGHGREKGFEGLLTYTRTKTVVVRLDA